MDRALDDWVNVYALKLSTLPMVPFADRRLLPTCCAVYFVLDEQHIPLYIGKARNLLLRWKQHHKRNSMRELHAMHIAWLAVSPTILHETEQSCIERFAPVWNINVHPADVPLRLFPEDHLTEEVTAMPRSKMKYVRQTIRIDPNLVEQLEALAGREFVSLNSLLNAFCELGLDLDATDAGRQQVHQACAQWRMRREHKLTSQRRAQQPPDPDTQCL